MSFNFFSLDYLYFPISGIMWVWHKVFGSFMGNDNAWAWVLSVVFLVFTLRAILFKPFLKQMESQLKMQAVQPEMKRLREKYKDDRQRLAEEMMKFNKEAGVNPLASCLPALVQAPVFIGLFHVLRMFAPDQRPDGTWFFRDQVYFFPTSDVVSFGNAKIFGGAPLGGSMTMAQGQLDFIDGAVRSDIIAVGVPLTILAGIATFLTSRRSVLRQRELNPEAAANPQSQMMNRLMMFVFPLFVVVGGPFFPLAILFYWLANNSWTFGQLWIVHRLQDKRKAAEVKVVEEAKEAARFSKPTPGAKPKSNRPVVQPKKVDGTEAEKSVELTKDTTASTTASSTASSTTAPSTGTSANGTAPTGASANGGTAKPKPAGSGNRPPNRSKKKRR